VDYLIWIVWLIAGICGAFLWWHTGESTMILWLILWFMVGIWGAFLWIVTECPPFNTRQKSLEWDIDSFQERMKARKRK
jgi:hypothetical protein